MQKSPGELTSSAADGNDNHAVSTHASSTLLQGQAEVGQLRSGAALSKFRAAAKKIVVTHEVRTLCFLPHSLTLVHCSNLYRNCNLAVRALLHSQWHKRACSLSLQLA
jgi:hypothetical protein